MVEYPTTGSYPFEPLAGVRVVDLGRVVSAPVATAALGALGAEVIRVEAPGGDLSWQLAPFVDPDGTIRPDRGDGGIPLGHLRRSRGKRSIIVDLRTAVGRDRLRDLIDEVDVVVENYRPGTLSRLGVDIEALRQRNEALIWCSINGYGSTGPWAERAAIDITVQAESGLLHRTGTPGGERVRAGATVVDHLAANWAVTAILAALMERTSTGRGRHLDVSMLEAIGSVMWDDALDAGIGVEERTGNDDPRGCPHGVYPCREGEIAIVVTSDRQWRALAVDLLNEPDLADLTARERLSGRGRVEQSLLVWLSRVDAESAAEALSKTGIAAGVVRPPETTSRHPQHRYREFLAPLRSAGGAITSFLGPALPFQVDGTNPRSGPGVEPLGASDGADLSRSSGPPLDRFVPSRPSAEKTPGLSSPGESTAPDPRSPAPNSSKRGSR